MLDLHHKESHRADVLAVVLNLFGLAGLCVLVACVVSDSGLWPSFSGDGVYTAARVLASERELPPAAPEVLPKRPEVEEVMWREPVGVTPGACEARAARSVQAEARRRQMQPQPSSCKRARLLSRRSTAPEPTV